MSSELQLPRFFIGWDVGGWNCDANSNSRDAIVILDEKRQLIGRPWRNNLRDQLNTATTSRAWIGSLFQLCGAIPPALDCAVTVAVDTPLGFSEAFLALTAELLPYGQIGDFRTNPYLFRQTERHLFECGYSPMSAVNHQIGSQATKGMHALAKFAPQRVQCGVWSDGESLRVIEAYPSACRHAEAVIEIIAGRDLQNEDKQDALVCAAIACLFETNRDALEAPPAYIPPREGWIWTTRPSGRTRLA